jgi:hypothetical protein
MKLWEIKAQALRLMFADTDVQFNFAEFQNGAIYANANTREKLIRMNDSIRRAIDLFFQYNGEITRTTNLGLRFTGTSIKTYFNEINYALGGYPTRVDVIENIDKQIYGEENIDFTFLKDNLKLVVDSGYVKFGGDISFLIYYKTERTNLTIDVEPNDLTFDLNTLSIPIEIQRQIPLYIKAEIYQEDEPQMANLARSEYIGFLLLNQRKNFSKVQTKVKRKFRRNFNV